MLWSPRQDVLPSGRQDLPPDWLPRGWHGAVSGAGLALAFGGDWQCLSSAVVNGGLTRAGGFLNMHLPEDCPLGEQDPGSRLQSAMRARQLPANSVGMMTGAWMRSLRLASAEVDGHLLAVLLTAGLSNARRAGDAAEQRSLGAGLSTMGTINLALVSTASLTSAALAETLTTVTEAKTAALQSLGVVSAVSGAIATGTGTDATAVFCPLQGRAIAYTGKHTLFGETAALLTIEALTDSLAASAQTTPAAAGQP